MGMIVLVTGLGASDLPRSIFQRWTVFFLFLKCWSGDQVFNTKILHDFHDQPTQHHGSWPLANSEFTITKSVYSSCTVHNSILTSLVYALALNMLIVKNHLDDFISSSVSLLSSQT